MFDKLKETVINKETRPISVSGSNDSVYMQEMLRSEERRSQKHQETVYERQQGYIK